MDQIKEIIAVPSLEDNNNIGNIFTKPLYYCESSEHHCEFKTDKLILLKMHQSFEHFQSDTPSVET